ncbi:serine hydrolase [Streptomyces sp. WMMC500]|uniref:serine hydrolase domain-containing protein n=1 Tax=Streptomyces sp. WMMC500 TaxID=3015154 RepID=UPI00248D1CBD|nr:serine hydrolase domain-containing protein [Streptomyces sp. WMMC500]WBB63089.1 serine hydrolase [Streptomyces sp. WMMC500]
MQRVRRVLVAASTVVAVVAVVAGSAAAVPGRGGGAPGPAGLQEKLDGLVAEGAVGALVEVRDGRQVWRGTSGVAERDTARAVPARGRFRIGSITKTFVATVVLQLVGEGRLRLDDPVEAWLPRAVPDGRRITVRHLLGHTSGLYDYKRTLTVPPDPAFLDYRHRTWTPEEQIARAAAHPPTSTRPGTVYAYSNTGYLLLGRIIEQATGRPYAQEIGRRILRPLRLHATSLPGTYPRIHGAHPRGYVPIEQEGGGTRLVDFTEMNPSLFGASGEMISTARDLDRFLAALLGGRLLPDRLLAEMRAPAVPERAYGLGLAWKETACGSTVYGNDGDAMTYQSWSFTTPDLRRHVTVALTPDHRADLDDSVDALLDAAFCG